MKWEQGRGAIDRMLANSELQRVPASREQAERLLAQARVHVASALQVCDTDPPGGYALAYDGARKALTAILENQGLRPTTRGGHLAVSEAVRAQLDPDGQDPPASSTACAPAGMTRSIRLPILPRSPQTTCATIIKPPKASSTSPPAL